MAKEWKGNSDSVRSRLAINKQHTTAGREKDDFYATDPVAVRRLVEGASSWLRGILCSCEKDIAHYEKSKYELYFNGEPHTYKIGNKLGEYYYQYFNIHPIIWEPAVGSCNLLDELHRLGYSAIGTDIKDRCGKEPKKFLNLDFLKTDVSFTRKYNIGVILTNPPYSLATKFALHSLEVLPENGIYCALMNVCYLSGQKRFREVYMTGTLREVYIFSKRIACYKNNDREAYNDSKMADYAWYVFQKGYFGQPTLYWL